MTLIRERDLEFSFDRPWTVVKWDECEFRKRREHHGAAVDVAAFHASGQLWLFEIKDYPAHPQVVAPVPSDLAEKCSRKVRDSLAQMLWSATDVGRPRDAAVEQLIRAFGSTDHPLMFALWIEDAMVPPLDLLVLQADLHAAFKWLPARVTTLSLGDAGIPGGLAVRRVPPASV